MLNYWRFSPKAIIMSIGANAVVLTVAELIRQKQAGKLNTQQAFQMAKEQKLKFTKSQTQEINKAADPVEAFEEMVTKVAQATGVSYNQAYAKCLDENMELYETLAAAPAKPPTGQVAKAAADPLEERIIKAVGTEADHPELSTSQYQAFVAKCYSAYVEQNPHVYRPDGSIDLNAAPPATVEQQVAKVREQFNGTA